jgi:hypothetical protein
MEQAQPDFPNGTAITLSGVDPRWLLIYMEMRVRGITAG